MAEFCTDISVRLMQHTGGDDAIAHAAWVSTMGADAEYASAEKVSGLINFLLKNRHGTPFEHGSMTFLVEAPIFVFREWHRHRVGWSYNEESGRYTKLKPKFYLPATGRALVQQGKPGHYTYVPGSTVQHELVDMSIKEANTTAYDEYEYMLSHGIAREVARMVLPVNIFSSMYATCNPRSLMHFLSLRTKDEESLFPSYPMAEIEMAARQMEDVFATLYPITHAAFEKGGRVAP